MYTSKLIIKMSSVNAWRSLCWWPDLTDCLITSSISHGRPQKKPADHNCWDDGEARREDLGWQSEDVVWRRHWRQTGRGRRGTGMLGCADSWTSWGRGLTEVIWNMCTMLLLHAVCLVCYSVCHLSAFWGFWSCCHHMTGWKSLLLSTSTTNLQVFSL